MKSKASALFAVVLIALAVLGFSYAWWTETLTINGTVETGELTVKMGNFGTKWWESIYWTIPTEFSGIIEGNYTISPDGYTLTIALKNLFPDGRATINFPIKNVGTIPAVIDSVTLAVISDPGNLKNWIEVWGRMRHIDKNGNVIGDDSFGYVPLEDADTQMYNLMSGKVLRPGETFAWSGEDGEGSLRFRMKSGAPDTTESQTITFTLTIIFKQFNAP